MDINSLLSPQETPRTTPSSPPKPPKRKGGRKPPPSKAPHPQSIHTSAPSRTSPYNAATATQRPDPTPLPSGRASSSRGSVTSTPSFDGARTYRQPSTAGMDTLADFASMQHHQQTARANATGLRSSEIYDSPKAAATSLPNLHNMTRSEAASRLRAGSFDVTMVDSPQLTPPPRTYFSRALSESELQSITKAGNHVQTTPSGYEEHAFFINLLHKGLLTHIRLRSTSTTSGDPHSYELLQVSKFLSFP